MHEGRDSRWRRGGRKLVVHFHIFKNAGTSIDHMLAAAFGTAWEAFEGSSGHDPMPPQRLADHLAERSGIEAVSSHLLRPPAPTGFDVFPIVLLRDPLDRAYSCYSHERRAAPNSESCEIARTSDFAGYVRWCLDHPHQGGMVILDYQTIHLSAASLRQPIYDAVALEADFAEAADLVRSLPAPGVVDQFDLFRARLQTALSTWRGEATPLGPSRRVNISAERARRPLAEARRDLETQLNEALLARFQAANRFDQALYDLASGLGAPS